MTCKPVCVPFHGICLRDQGHIPFKLTILLSSQIIFLCSDVNSCRPGGWLTSNALDAFNFHVLAQFDKFQHGVYIAPSLLVSLCRNATTSAGERVTQSKFCVIPIHINSSYWAVFICFTEYDANRVHVTGCLDSFIL